MANVSASPTVPVYYNHHELLHFERADTTALLCRRCGKSAPDLTRFDSIACDTTDHQLHTR